MGKSHYGSMWENYDRGMVIDISSELDLIFFNLFRVDLSVIKTWTYDSVPEWDSLAQIQLVLSIEERWQIKISPKDVAFLETYGDFFRYIQDHAQ